MEAPRPANRWLEILAMAYFGFFPTVGAILLTSFLIADPGLYQTHLDDPWPAWVVVSGLAIGLGLLPNTLVALAFGFSWGMQSTPAFAMGYALAVILGYGIAKILPGRFIQGLIDSRPKWKAGFENLKNEGLKTVIFLRLSPIFPFGMTNLVLSWLGFRFWKTLLGSLIGMLSTAVVLIYLGSQASKLADALHAGSHKGMLGLALGLTALALYGLYHLWNPPKTKQA